jgi:hypothetical protein
VAVIIGLNSGKGSSSGHEGAQTGSGTGSGREDDLASLPADPVARAEALVQFPKPLPAPWKLAPMKEGTRLYVDREQYYVTKFSKGLEGGAMLVRSTSDTNQWLPAKLLSAKSDCNVFAIIQYRYLGKVQVPDDMMQKLAGQGWQETTETVETTSQGEDWQWKVLRKTVKKGDDIGGLKGMEWKPVNVLFVFK